MEWKLFADLAEVAGDDRVDVTVSADATVGDALEALLDERPALRERVLADDGTLYDHVNLLRNGADATLDDAVDGGDELALFPPVSGG
ncbi:ubiquitin-like small modifier protein 1 [Halarchaeum nitratireducens]|uniref:Molybdopterin synthase sulfur carrier subunit n=1 Tax=Halarchaeum nitratireducens TaxID=489913 RepID=A0A830G7Z0_9EURY|nr:MULTISPECIES: ubiquitin-like small modifier protein 1 [Halarchaeum]MBP2251421.1 molybdopterin synthase sulfur carrier subunit [Halarchaeum solikamskense]GGN07407.1 molybdopterin synthase sulfur carrier subunit [Halarchaeum nitratireducens]